MSEPRRLFFDDGSSRKRWQVLVKGKSQIVQYGRLGGTQRESKKTFKTPGEAAESTDKLIASKKCGGYKEINCSRLEIGRHKGTKAATEKQIKAFEKQLACSLPDEYRSFLRTHNGGIPNPDCVQVPGVPYIDNVGVGVLFYLQASKPKFNELTHELKRIGSILPKGHLPIAGSSDVFTLSLKPKLFGCVYWWNHETDTSENDETFVESDGHLLAGSFDEFLTRIALLYGDEDETATASKKNKPKASIKRLLRLMNHDHTPEKIREIEEVVKAVGELSGIKDGDWPFNNIDNVRLLRCLLKSGLNPEITDTENQTLLWQCASSVACINLLLKNDVDLERRNGSERETALMRAMFLERIPAVKRLIEAGANPTVRLQSYISSNLTYNKQLGEIVDKARVQWKRKKAKKKKAKRKSVAK